jgi:hypothetical protein
MDCFRLCRICAKKQKGTANRAALALARKLVAYLMAYLLVSE